ncbi:uncharacterized protein BJ212DRAFT_1585262 [Suillus subaureus]|uniref:Uncharacterized protein n=1 Tax=Suillus subaureus TaxID=48587 RepID=A0A9P7EL82_9AGAM|nr:uncharacterized protein BJ212DRAFT_1585262 [Suillus subaureus]KAG1823972.1 hypothetical protein BJ212DRAFT_1585262 [Suillus subaureus]
MAIGDDLLDDPTKTLEMWRIVASTDNGLIDHGWYGQIGDQPSVNGLEIPGLKEALVKILHDFHLQISLLEGCQTILNGDSSDLAKTRSKGQNSGFFMKSRTICVLFHASCIDGMTDIYSHEEPSEGMSMLASGVSAKIALHFVNTFDQASFV